MRFLSNKEKKELQPKLPPGYEIDKKDEIKEGEGVLYKGEEKFLITKDSNLLPHLRSIPEEQYKSVYVDKGAIPFIAKGADLMRPGIREIDMGFEKGDVVMIRDENKRKTFALGIALLSSGDMKEQERGKSLQIYHFLGDPLY